MSCHARGAAWSCRLAVAGAFALVCVAAGGCRRARSAAPDAAPRRAHAARPAPLACAGLQGCVDRCGGAGADACVAACVARLTPAARPYYDALQACVVPACADADAGAAPCRASTSWACKMCVLGRCAGPAAACMAH